jgi:hypothetical protein
MVTSCPCAHRKFAGALAVFVAAEGELVQTEGGARSNSSVIGGISAVRAQVPHRSIVTDAVENWLEKAREP